MVAASAGTGGGGGRRCGFGVACGRRGIMTAVGGGAGGAQARHYAETAAVAAACEVQGAAPCCRRRLCVGAPAWLAALGHGGLEVVLADI